MKGLKTLLRLGLLLVVLLGCGTAVFILYTQWLGNNASVLGGDGNQALSSVERFYLQVYLARNVEALQQPAGTAVGTVAFVIESGETADTISNNLVQAHLLNDADLFRSYIRYVGIDAELEAGEYNLTADLTIPELAEALTRSVVQETSLTFIEGWRVEEMADLLAAQQPALIDANTFLSIVKRQTPYDLSQYDFLASLPVNESLEGFMFPDTYRVPADANAAYLVDLMLQNFGERVTPAMRQAFGSQGLLLREAVTLASIIEREAVVGTERPLMAGVFYNRLAQGMRLEADPTVQYPLGYQTDTGSWWKSPLYFEDLELKSPYNTYEFDGLPPGPIANPGLASLQAVAEPTANDYIFFVVDCTSPVPGTHNFSVTYDEHVANVQKCR
ncbi:MAG: endolytic transglycosylase MltG [Chloroflexi bacterium]|nr:MAG: endolytic transglycosylase MltG [Chloroflexota bacterium]